MKHQIDYSKKDIPIGETKESIALKDLREYLGKTYIRLLEGFISNPPKTEQGIRIRFAFCGIQGFPVDAFIKTFYPQFIKGE